MNLSDNICKSISSDGRKIVRISSKVSPEFGEETIHKLRRSVKKMRALSRWIGVSDTVMSSYFKKLYKTAGKIRDAQLLFKKINEEKDVHPGLILWLDSYLEKMKNKWDKIYDESDIKQWHKSLKENLTGENAQPDESFIKKKLQELHDLTAEIPLTDETIHKVRKLLKDIQFVYEWQQKEAPETGETIPINELNELSDEAGKFMDITIGIELLKLYIENEKDEEACSKAKQLLDTWKKDKETEREKLKKEFGLYIPWITA